MSAFTCISCRVSFLDAQLQRGHYKTDWHRYNLKRKVADLPPVTAEEFQQRVHAQKAQVEEEEKDQSSHCAVCNKHFNTKNAFENHLQSKKHKEAAAKQKDRPEQDEAVTDEYEIVAQKNAKNLALKAQSKSTKTNSSQTADVDDGMPGCSGQGATSSGAEKSTMEMEDDDGSDAESWESWDGDALGLEECLFCSHVSASLEKNVKHMTVKHSFFVPDLEYVSDLEGLITYLGEKVGEGRICLWCNEKSKAFLSTRAVQQHMVDKGHCKMLHDGDAVYEYTDYYDYRSSYPDFEEGSKQEEMDVAADADGDVSPDVLDEENYQLVLPSGAVIGHRSLLRYYRQKLRPDRQVVLRNPSTLSRVMAQYKALGWTGTVGVLAQKKARDMAYIRRVDHKQRMRLGIKANKMQHHFRIQNL